MSPEGRYYIARIMKNTLYILLAILAFVLVRNWENRDITHPPGVLVPEMPRQNELAQSDPIIMGDYSIKPRADFTVRARVLSREEYRWSDGSDLSPVDLALGWGVMSDQEVLDRIRITQGSRWYYTRYDHPAPLSDQQIIRHSGNMHMIPANDWVEDKLSEIRTGDVIQARGYLVEVDRSVGFRWRTSLSRNVTGNGSCELFYMEHLFIEPRG